MRTREDRSQERSRDCSNKPGSHRRKRGMDYIKPRRGITSEGVSEEDNPKRKTTDFIMLK